MKKTRHVIESGLCCSSHNKKGWGESNNDSQGVILSSLWNFLLLCTNEEHWISQEFMGRFGHQLLGQCGILVTQEFWRSPCRASEGSRGITGSFLEETLSIPALQDFWAWTDRSTLTLGSSVTVQPGYLLNPERYSLKATGSWFKQEFGLNKETKYE